MGVSRMRSRSPNAVLFERTWHQSTSWRIRRLRQASKISQLPREDLSHPLERFADVLAGVGVREAQMAFAVAAECRTGEARHACLVEEKVGESVSRKSGLGDAREGVESPLGCYAFDARELVEAAHDQVPARPELGEHAPHCVLGTLEGRESGVLSG